MTMIAIIQRPPVLLDRAATITSAVRWVAETAAAGASLIVFNESFIPGYPSWIWRLAAGRDGAVMGKLHARLLANTVDVAAGDLAERCEATRTHRVAVVCGINERDRAFGGGTLYNSVVVIGPNGQVLSRYRKLMPTNPERMVHALGDASGLRVIDTPACCMQRSTLRASRRHRARVVPGDETTVSQVQPDPGTRAVPELRECRLTRSRPANTTLFLHPIALSKRHRDWH